MTTRQSKLVMRTTPNGPVSARTSDTEVAPMADPAPAEPTIAGTPEGVGNPTAAGVESVRSETLPAARASFPADREAKPGPADKPRRRARLALIVLLVAWLAIGVAVLGAIPNGFVVTRWWAYGFAFLALNTVLAGLVMITWDALRHMVLGADHRLSTSKVQVAAWTYLVLFAICALMLMGKSLNCPATSQTGCVQIRAPLARAFDELITTGLQPSYLLLLGLPTAAAVAAKAITVTKIASAQSQGLTPAKTPAPDVNLGLGDRLAELVSDDSGATDLGNLQYHLFNLLTMAWFLITFLPHPLNPQGLPELPATLIGLTGVSTAGYVTKKALEPSAADNHAAPQS
jgi:hypothetical protein